MDEAAGQAGAAQQSLYPPPPDFYRLYREDADGTAERPLPPGPPAPVVGDYQMFGEMHTVRHDPVNVTEALFSALGLSYSVQTTG